MIEIDNDKCIGCGICLKYRGGYCLRKRDGIIEIDALVCNECQKCIALCPGMAFSNNGRQPEPIQKPLPVHEEDFMELVRRRRSIRYFTTEKVPEELLERIVRSCQYAPTTNKDIEAIVVDDPQLMGQIDEDALRFYGKTYRLLFGSRLLFGFFRLFAETLPVIKRKMERDLVERKHIIKDNTQALILLIGNKKVPVTESSAQYYLSNMLLFCETVGLGSCLMDSLKISLNNGKSIKKTLCIPKGLSILGVFAVGYPEEKIINIPEGYRIKIGWNGRR